ncbi:hypothetical protein RND71_031982 [Anisodus tanguticus]|uniref:Uncharacterized protein n=1 Tax=Anisodus tanguticus TaxID=243964 RepID=A0AAE1REA9_9SOLA|nr:hypothetical protein RND71_031982 [Anisodus tanguticus]
MFYLGNFSNNFPDFFLVNALNVLNMHCLSLDVHRISHLRLDVTFATKGPLLRPHQKPATIVCTKTSITSPYDRAEVLFKGFEVSVAYIHSLGGTSSPRIHHVSK